MVRLLAVLLFAALLLYCTRAERAEHGASKNVEPSSAGRSTSPNAGAPITLERSRPDADKSRPERVEVDRLPVTRNDALLSLMSEVEVPTADYELGTLFSGSGSSDERAILRTADVFFRGLAAGSIAENAVSPESLRGIARSLRSFLDSDLRVTSARYAAPVIDDALVGQVRVRVFGENGDTVGILILTYTDRGWRVVDLQADLTKLGTPRPARSEPFEPFVYRRGGR